MLYLDVSKEFGRVRNKKYVYFPFDAYMRVSMAQITYILVIILGAGVLLSARVIAVQQTARQTLVKTIPKFSRPSRIQAVLQQFLFHQ